MLLKLLLTLSILFSLLPLLAQKTVSGSVRGKIVDTSGKQSMEEATISVMDLKDSGNIAFSTANEKGLFEIKGIEEGRYRLLVSFGGYQSVSRLFSVTREKPAIDLGNIIMDRKSTTLQEVIVERPPISVKKDTVEYNASSFKTKPNEDVEGLLKKLPGVQVDRDGTVKSQGETVQKVYVDGKEFFGTDPKLATKNLTADMVESVQVFDDMSDQAKFTKIDDGSRQKAMNIKLKKDKKNGYFGKINLGAGTDKRYDNNLSFNKFKGSRQISLIGAINNTNKQGFSFSDIISTMGGLGNGGMGGGGGFGAGPGGQGGGGGAPGGGLGGVGQLVATRGGIAGLGFGGASNGITSSISGGLNYRDSWGSKIDVSGSYFISHTKNESVQNVFRQTFFPNDSTTNSNDDRVSENQNTSHRFNLRFEYRIDSMNSLLYTPSFTVQQSNGFSNDTSSVYAISPALKYLALAGNSYNENDRNGINLNNNLLYRRRLNKTGRTFTLGFSNTYNHSNGNGLNISPQVLFTPSGDTLSRYLSQHYQSAQTTNANNNVLSASYTEPVGKNKLVEINYAYTNNQNKADKRTNNFDTLTGKYERPNPQQTNYFTNSFTANRVGANFRVQQKKYNYQLGGTVQFAALQSHVFNNGSSKDSVISRHYINFNPNANFNYSPRAGQNLRFNYRGRTNQPSTTQLQNVLDVSNPQNIRTGDPDLKQEFIHNLNMGYNRFVLANFQFIAFNVNASLTQNKIANSIDTLGRGVQLTKPVNLNGAYNASMFFTYGKTMKKLKGGNINATSFIIYNKDVSLLYKQRNYTNAFIATQSLGLNYNHKQLDIGFNGALSYNNVKYSLQSSLNSEYYTQTYSPEINYTFFKRLVASTDLDYTLNSGLSAGYNQQVDYWNASLALQVFKKKDGEIKLAVYDILNQNKSYTRSTGDNYIQDTRTNVLNRYLMLS
ncbi:MAG TPA: TonB-dependent receptor, partial [Chitinophagaceae bacterium]|nr:TonB-dependent receptor [Chitinophagaceae bacterium]